MRVKVNEKTFDTDSAKLFAHWDNEQDCSDAFNYVSENLYFKEDVGWFLYGEGGPCTKYGIPSKIGGVMRSSSGIIILEEHEAITWLKNHFKEITI